MLLVEGGGILDVPCVCFLRVQEDKSLYPSGAGGGGVLESLRLCVHVFLCPLFCVWWCALTPRSTVWLTHYYCRKSQAGEQTPDFPGAQVHGGSAEGPVTVRWHPCLPCPARSHRCPQRPHAQHCGGWLQLWPKWVQGFSVFVAVRVGSSSRSCILLQFSSIL